jgi:hypothetical protein
MTERQLTGWFVKAAAGRLGKAQRRFFVLSYSERKIRYYARLGPTGGGQDEKGEVALTSDTQTRLVGKVLHLDVPGRSFALTAETETAGRLWLDALTKLLASGDDSLSSNALNASRPPGGSVPTSVSSASLSESEDTVAHRGWLEKKPERVGRTQTRYFELHPRELRFYDDCVEGRGKGERGRIPLTGASLLHEGSRLAVTAGRRTYELAAPTAEAGGEWAEAFFAAGVTKVSALADGAAKSKAASATVSPHAAAPDTTASSKTAVGPSTPTAASVATANKRSSVGVATTSTTGSREPSLSEEEDTGPPVVQHNTLFAKDTIASATSATARPASPPHTTATTPPTTTAGVEQESADPPQSPSPTMGFPQEATASTPEKTAFVAAAAAASPSTKPVSTGRLQEGWLTKAAEGRGRSQRRYFVLAPGSLAYYASAKGEVPAIVSDEKGSIPLSAGSTLIEVKGPLLLVHTPGRIYRLETETPSGADKWRQKLLQAGCGVYGTTADDSPAEAGNNHEPTSATSKPPTSSEPAREREGWLTKKAEGAGRSRRRYFVLMRGVMLYYGTATGAPPARVSDEKGRVALDGTCEVEREGPRLTLHARDRVFYLEADDDTSAIGWYETFIKLGLAAKRSPEAATLRAPSAAPASSAASAATAPVGSASPTSSRVLQPPSGEVDDDSGSDLSDTEAEECIDMLPRQGAWLTKEGATRFSRAKSRFFSLVYGVQSRKVQLRYYASMREGIPTKYKGRIVLDRPEVVDVDGRNILIVSHQTSVNIVRPAPSQNHFIQALHSPSPNHNSATRTAPGRCMPRTAVRRKSGPSSGGARQSISLQPSRPRRRPRQQPGRSPRGAAPLPCRWPSALSSSCLMVILAPRWRPCFARSTGRPLRRRAGRSSTVSLPARQNSGLPLATLPAGW